MDTTDLTIFRHVYDSGSLTAAAAECFMSAQGVSRVIKKLETELNDELFIRSSSGMIPTKRATDLYRKSLKIMELLSADTHSPSTFTIVFAIGVKVLCLLLG